MSEGTPLERLKALCPMRHRDYRIGDMDLTLWTASDLDPLLDRLMSKAESDPDVQDERMPYWAELWPSSFLMAEVMMRHHPKLPEGDFLELGCGPALPSCTAARLGKRGIATDYLEEARWLAELNLCENGVRDQVRVQHLDWRKPGSFQASWILAGDVAYEERNFQPLMDCWESLLCPGGQIWLAEPGRSIAKPFFEALTQAGWAAEVIGEKERINVFRIQQRK